MYIITSLARAPHSNPPKTDSQHPNQKNAQCKQAKLKPQLQTTRTVAITPRKSRSLPFDEVRRICHDHTLAGLEAVFKAHSQGGGTSSPFRFLYMSGTASERDQGKKPRLMADYYLMRVREPPPYPPLPRLFTPNRVATNPNLKPPTNRAKRKTQSSPSPKTPTRSRWKPASRNRASSRRRASTSKTP